MDPHLRPLSSADEPMLRRLLWHAIHVPAGTARPDESIVDSPELSRYFRNWGQPNDVGFAAEVEGKVIGAAYVRLLTGENRGYGYIDDHTPELSIALLPEWRGRGVGTSLLNQLLNVVQLRFAAISLSVAEKNRAIELYRRFGFTEVARSGTSITMCRRL